MPILMDRKLYDAARTGNVRILHELIQENNDVLEKVPFPGSAKIPLHIATLFGHLEFVKQLLASSIMSTKQLNQLNEDGYTPLHLAAANGDRDMVELLIDFGYRADNSMVFGMCLMRDKNGRNPLHCAAVRGRIPVLGSLIVACPESTFELTVSERETVIHLALRNNQCEAFLFLVQDPNMESVLNFADREGNTALHLAAARKQSQIIEFLLSKPNLVDVNARNTYGLTALDVFMMNNLQSNDFETEELIQLAGGKRSKNLPPILNQEFQVQISQSMAPPYPNLIHSSNPSSNNNDEWVKEMRSGILVMASLVATVTFEAALNPPGPSEPPAHTNSTDPAHHSDTKALQKAYDLVRGKFSWFMFFDLQAFLVAISIIVALLSPRAFRHDSTKLLLYVRNATYLVIAQLALLMVWAIEVNSRFLHLYGYVILDVYCVILINALLYWFM